MPRRRGGLRPSGGAVLLAVAVLADASPSGAQPVIPDPVGYVNDFAGVLSPQEEAAVARVIEEVRARSGGEIVVVTLPSLGDMSRAELARRIGERWGVGRRGEADGAARRPGALVLIVPEETSPDGRGPVEIALSFGADAFITATEAGRIRDRLMIPALREGDHGRGITLGVTALAEGYARHFGFELTGEIPVGAAEPRPSPPALVSFLVLVVLSLVLLAAAVAYLGFRHRRGSGAPRGAREGRGPLVLPLATGRWHRGSWGGFGGGLGGGGFGGFGGFGAGGGFGGGGAGGSR